MRPGLLEGNLLAPQASPFKVFDASIGRDKQAETEEQREQLGSGVDLLRKPLPSPFLPVVFCSWGWKDHRRLR
jgi:hypothetical protein